MKNLENNDDMIHQIDTPVGSKMSVVVFFVLVAFAVVVGVIIGLVPSKLSSNKSTQTNNSSATASKSVGVVDKKTFKDSVTGILRNGGIDGEGNFHIERPGGDSQNAYLTSSTVDLTQFVGKKVTVWGQTYSSQKAGWLMDVGLVEVLK
jgi:hypothetical protein